jgi:Fe-S oxidoreductase
MSKMREQPVDSSKIRNILQANSGARIRTWLGICSRCGLCAESCFVYLSNDRNPKLSPAYKFLHTLGEMYRRKGGVDHNFLDQCFEILWLQCTMCKRCSMYCPFGIDIATMIAVARSVCHSQGVTPEKLAFFSENCRTTGNHMGIPVDELIDTCEWMVEETEEDYRGVTIPIDKKGARYMYTINPREPVFYPQDIANAAIIFSVAEENWTIPSRGWDCTNLPMFAGDHTLAGRVVRDVYDKAAELEAEKVLITECGHAYRSLAYEGPYLAGYADGKPPVEIVHYVQLIYEYLRDGRIRIDPNKKLKDPVTYQDPCNVSRNGGLCETARKIMPYLAEDFASGAKLVVAPCHNCFDQVNDLSEAYMLGVKALSLKEIICEIMIVPDKFNLDRPENDHRTP